jgi:hypothetical protein
MLAAPEKGRLRVAPVSPLKKMRIRRRLLGAPVGWRVGTEGHVLFDRT